MQIKKQYMTENDCYKQGKKINPKGIMIHSTATPGIMAKDWFSRWNKPGIEVAVHFFVDDQNIVQYLPCTMRGWHCAGTGNNTHIGIEICEPKNRNTDGTYFKKAILNTLVLVAQLCREYGISVKNITSHCEGYKLGIAGNHADPMHWFPCFDYNMDLFRKDLESMLSYESGDINQDGSITVTDLVRLRKFIMSDTYRPEVDLNSDGKISVSDIVELRGHIMNKTQSSELKRPVLAQGSEGEDVKHLQIKLIQAKFGYSAVDGFFGPKTHLAVKTFQKSRNINVDGTVDTQTWAELNTVTGNPFKKPTRDLKKGDRGEDVKWLQLSLETAGFTVGSCGVDGSFGIATLGALMAFQVNRRLKPNGICDRQTMSELEV